MKIIFDYNRTLFNPETDMLYEGVFELLDDLGKKHELFLISRFEPIRMEKFQKLGIKNFFKKTLFVEEKTSEIFLGISPFTENTLVVGDSIKDEIRIGNILGYTTIRIEQGKFSGQVPSSKEEKPDYIIKKISELKTIIEKYEH